MASAGWGSSGGDCSAAEGDWAALRLVLGDELGERLGELEKAQRVPRL
jgi:hypothetical protein